MFDKEEIFKTIKATKVVSYRTLMDLFPEEPSMVLDDFLEDLICSGRITLFRGQYYPIIRSIGIIPKGEGTTTHELKLEDLSVDEIKQLFTPKKDDPLFFDGYLIDESKAILFKRFKNIAFDFSHFDYYLLCGFDN